MHGWVMALCLGCCGPLASAQGAGDRAEPVALDWNARHAEHLWNRAGFGAGPAEVARAVALGPEAFVDELLAGEGFVAEPFYSRVRRQVRLADAQEKREDRLRMRREMRQADDEQLEDFLGWWVDRMVDGRDPLRERMTLFWHGHFTSSNGDVKNSHEMIQQNQLFRELGLGGFRELLRAVARDPAMLEYLDNDANRKKKPNENFARELMELFTLGEGNYDETDVKEAARAFTGWTDREGRFRFNRGQHDKSQKTILGKTGKFNGDDVIDILLEQDPCARFLAGKLLRYFEGGDPEAERLERYAAHLRDNDYDISGFLRTLFLDPAFYSEDIRGARIAGPIDFLVGSVRRLGVDAPPRLVLVGSTLLGQRLFYPPNVKGWEGGRGWISTSTLMQRANLAGVLLGQVTLDDFIDYDPERDPELAELLEGAGGSEEMAEASESDDSSRPRMSPNLGELKGLRRIRWRPRLHIAARLRRVGVQGDRGIIGRLGDALLAVPMTAASRAELERFLAAERERIDASEADFLANSEVAEPILRRTAHLILSLPEAQLN